MPDFSRKRAILIGADKYKRVRPLEFCADDAHATAEAFRESLQFKPEDILELTVRSGQPPHRNDILHELGELPKKGIMPDELLVFYFAGHGLIDQENQLDYLLPMDVSPNNFTGTSISIDEVIKALSATGCSNIVMFIDACREDLSGARSVSGLGQFSIESVERSGIVTFFSCDPRERSYEISDLGHGSFTYCILRAIENGDCPTVQLMDTYLRKEVPLLNDKYKKPPQRPFTAVKPLDKFNLPYFFSERQIVDIYEILYTKLAELFARNRLDGAIYNKVALFIEQAKVATSLSVDDKSRMNFVELLCDGKLQPGPFARAWDALERSQLKPSSPPKPL
jgi:uncharacterized caspase-like protein